MSDAAVETPAGSSRNQSYTATKLPDQQITLVDHTAPAQDADSEDNNGDGPSLNRSSSDPLLTRKWTKTNLQQQLAQRKYAKYREDRYTDPEEQQQGPGDEGVAAAKSKYGLGKGRIKGLYKKRRNRQAEEEDAVIDILYENQRGSFFVGIPLFSSKSLLNFDPKPWINAHMKTSPVNITNAQVPDPNWEWTWKSWYVDMSRDVDEEGWEYSFSFQKGFAWHGNHPWFHSFVRRRRWLRKRVRKHAHHGDGKMSSQRHMEDAHKLTSEYFTIHPSRRHSPGSSRTPSLAASSGGLLKKSADVDDDEDKADIRDIATLFVYLKKAAIDREKLVLVKSFVSNTSAELFYLAEQMHNIMALFIFQNSRRNLLGILMEQFAQASNHREEHKAHNEEEGASEKTRTNNLLKAINAADEEVKRLEYWSDIRRIAREGDAISAVDDSTTWPSDQWQGLDNSGPASDLYSSAKEDGKTVHELHKDAEVIEERGSADLGLNGKETKALSTQESDDTFLTAWDSPAKVDKGKGRAE